MSHHDHHDSHHHGEHADAAHHGVGHIVPPRILIAVGGALLVLTWLTVAATWVDLGEANVWIALGIATVKVALVALFFMHLWWDRPFNGIMFVLSVLLVMLFIGFALTDTKEYAASLDPGDARVVRDRLTEIQKPIVER